jgi:hypothetical protein
VTFIRFACRLAVLCAAPALAACTTSGNGQVSLLAPSVTHQRASAECWMQTEKSMQKVDLDRRVDVVNRCIEDKLSGRA